MTAETQVGPEFPLRSWFLKHFKSIGETKMSFAPLTVLVGANSTGKSSIIQSLLLVAQAAQGRTSGADFPLNGPLASLGGFEDTRSTWAPKEPMTLGGEFELPTSRVHSWSDGVRRPRHSARVQWQVSLHGGSTDAAGSARISAVRAAIAGDGEGTNPDAALDMRRRRATLANGDEQSALGARLWPRDSDYSLAFTGRVTDSITPRDGSEARTNIRGADIRAGIPHDILQSLSVAKAAAVVWLAVHVGYPLGRTGFPTTSVIFPRRPSPLRPARELVPANERARIIDDAVETALGEIGEWLESSTSGSLARFVSDRRVQTRGSRIRGNRSQEEAVREFVLRDSASQVLRRVTTGVSTEGMSITRALVQRESRVAEPLFDQLAELHRFFRDRVTYLGPLREDPQVAYRATPLGTAGFIGSKGEYLASVLQSHANQPVLCPMPTGAADVLPLSQAVDLWIGELGLARSVSTKDLGRLGIQVTVDRPDVARELDLTSVGVGVSQLLPVLVSCLRAPPMSLILLEQPELHLHPAVQQGLGDFLLACARSGRQLLVETHSEYLVTRLRRRLAEDESSVTSEHVALVFAEQQGGMSTFQRLETNEFGAVLDWPSGFFDQASIESRRLLEAGMRRRRERSPSSLERPAGETQP